MRFHGGVSRWFSKRQTCAIDNIGAVEELNNYILLIVQFHKLSLDYKLRLILTTEYFTNDNTHLIQINVYPNNTCIQKCSTHIRSSTLA